MKLKNFFGKLHFYIKNLYSVNQNEYLFLKQIHLFNFILASNMTHKLINNLIITFLTKKFKIV